MTCALIVHMKNILSPKLTLSQEYPSIWYCRSVPPVNREGWQNAFSSSWCNNHCEL